ncbi:MAG: NADP-dependent oxidoreductase [Bacteroidota bacterium]
MKAIIRNKPGKEFTSMAVQEVEQPLLGANDVMIKMVSSRINPVDMDLMKGFPGLKYPPNQIGGVDGAGEVVKIGSAVTDFKSGDHVYFYRPFNDVGTWAEYISIPSKYIAKIPNGISLDQAGSIALPSLTALESILQLSPQKGESILIHGAAGGVGFMAVQIAKQLGLAVITTNSSKDAAVLEPIGISKMIDYRKEDFSEVLKDQPPTYILDVLGGENLMKSIQLGPKAVVSTSLPDTSQMGKTGVELNWLFKKIMNLMNKRFTKLAKKKGVILKGQVTGPNQQNMKQFSEIFNSANLITKPVQELSLEEIQAQGMSKKSVGKVIVF